MKYTFKSIINDIYAGVYVFLSMVYVLSLHPYILSLGGWDQYSAFITTIMMIIIPTLVLGFYAKVPLALAPGLGLNSFIVFTIINTYGLTISQALGIIFISGVIFLSLTLLGIRYKIMQQIPNHIIYSLEAILGIFIAIIALLNSNILTLNESNLLEWNGIFNLDSIVAVIFTLILYLLNKMKIPYAIFIVLISATTIYLLINSKVQIPNSFFSIPHIPHNFYSLSLNFSNIPVINILFLILSLFLTESLSSSSTLLILKNKSKHSNKKNIQRAILIDSGSTVFSSIIGNTNITTYLESFVALKANGKGYVVNITVAILFALSLFITPLLQVIPSVATAPIIMLVAVSMINNFIQNINLNLHKFTILNCILSFLIIIISFDLSLTICVFIVAESIIYLLRSKSYFKFNTMSLVLLHLYLIIMLYYMLDKIIRVIFS